MLSYEVLDAIADSYIPILVLYTLLLIIKVGLNDKIKFAITYLLILFIGVVPVYLIMYLDIRFQLWPIFFYVTTCQFR